MAKRLTIAGRVQGVGYRASFYEMAQSLSLRGWVRNRRDGTVEACVDGETAAIEAIIAWAERGPPAAQVNQVSIEEVAELIDAAFEILPTQ